MNREIERMRFYQKLTPEHMRKVLARKAEIMAAVKDLSIGQDTRIFLVANGSSGEGVQIASFIWERVLDIRPYVVSPYQFNNYPAKLKETDIVLALSQTGTSHEVVEALRTAKKQGAKTIGVTAAENTAITKEADIVILVPEGKEDVDYKVVGVVVNMLVVILVGYGLAEAKGKAHDLENVAQEIYASSERYFQTAALVENWVSANFEWLNQATSFTCVGSGPLLEVAEEWAIKMIEVTNKQCFYIDVEEYLHGACAVTDPQHVTVMVIGNENREYAEKVFNASVKFGKKTVWLGPQGPEGQCGYTLSDDEVVAVFDALAAVHAFVIAYGDLGNYGGAGTGIFAFYQNELKVREG